MIFRNIKKKFILLLSLGLATSLVTSVGLFATSCSSDNSNAISARDNTDIANGLTTVEYEAEKWIGDNSVSISFVSTPNITYLKSYLSSYLTSHSNDENSSNSDASNSYALVSSIYSNINQNETSYSKNSSITAGTGWILDYSVDESNSDLVTYYLATNMHVLNASFSISYEANFKTSYDIVIPYTIEVTFPISSQTVTNLSVYLSQPQYSTTSATNNLKIPLNSASDYSTAWYKTSITKDNVAESLIPLGSYNTSGLTSTNSTSYGMTISYYPLGSSSSLASNLYFPTDGSSGTSTVTNGTPQASDFSILKISENKSSFENLSTSGTYGTVFTKIKKMFDVDTTSDETTKSSSYIARLNSLLEMTNDSSKYNKEDASELFMFADYSKDLNSSTILSIAGFPSTSSGSSFYTNFNSNTISYSLATNVSSSSYSARTNIEYNYNGNFYYSTYNWPFNLLLRNVNLLAGSSGSMAVTQDYKITGIYWGTLTSYGVTNGTLGTIVDGVMTKLYSNSVSSSMINIWLAYVAKNDTNSKLATLFTNLKKLNYFS